MREIELCMRYDTCNRCPLNQRCEEEYQKEMEQKSGDIGEKDLSILRCGERESHLSIQEKPTKERGQAE